MQISRPRRASPRARHFACIAAFCLIGLGGVAGCADSQDIAPSGSAFSQALFQNYSVLASEAGPAPETADNNFLDSLWDTLTFNSAPPADPAARALRDKASLAALGEEPAPEPASADGIAQGLRGRLVRAIAAGKDKFPDQAARAQADFDCWMLESPVPRLSDAARACRSAFESTLPSLEAALRPPPVPVLVPVAPTPVAAPPADYTAYFDFNSWTLTAEDLGVITHAINTARAGGQTRITVVGHTDTSGSAAYNQGLSVRRANVVVEALVDMGARRAAIHASGVGESDLAVATPDGVQEAKNRRAVIALVP